MKIKLPRIVVAAVSSGGGKTTVVTGLLSALRQKGLKVQSYKVGPDYIDPGYHRLASGYPAHNLDSWLMPEDKLREIFIRTSKEADISVVEGVMGLYDGGRSGVSSTAEIAKLLDAPVVLVIDAKSMGASAAAIALGFREYDQQVKLAGVILNRLGSDTHRLMIEKAMQEIGIPVLGAIKRDDSLAMPERHLGLLPVEENQRELEAVEAIGRAVVSQTDLVSIIRLADKAGEMELADYSNAVTEDDKNVTIAVARDDAFSFYYPESLRILEKSGARIILFSPLKDKELPFCDGVILGGGFPEMFAEALRCNYTMLESIKNAAESGMPIYSECGGFMYLTQAMIDFDGIEHTMAGVLPCRVQMNKKLQMVGYVSAEMNTDTVLGPKGTRLHGHEFHFSSEIIPEKDCRDKAFTFTRMRNNAVYQAGYAWKNVLGSYLHLHFAGCPEAADYFVEKCKLWRK